MDFELEWTALGQLVDKHANNKDALNAKEAERSAKVNDPIEEEENKVGSAVIFSLRVNAH